MTLIDGSTFANSSIAMMAVVNDAFVPPYSSGISMAMSYMEMSAPSGMKHVRMYTMFEETFDDFGVNFFCFVLIISSEYRQRGVHTISMTLGAISSCAHLATIIMSEGRRGGGGVGTNRSLA